MADQSPQFAQPNNTGNKSMGSGPAPSSQDPGTEPKGSGPQPNSKSVQGPGDGSKEQPKFMR